MKIHGIPSGLTLVLVGALTLAAVPLGASAAAAAPGTLSLVATSADGAAFDFDEYAAGDVTVQVTDSVAGDVDVDDAQDLSYHWTITPFDTTADASRLPATGEDVQVDETNGEFVVPLPAGATPGKYTLVAELAPDGGGANAVSSASILTVRAGDAAIAFEDDSPLRAAAGNDRLVPGRVLLEDGTGLPDRLVDLEFIRGTAGTDPEADAGFAPALPDTTPVTTIQETTGTDGSFEVTLRDPAEDGQGTELGGTLEAATAATPGTGDADADSSISVDLITENAPAGSTLLLSDLGSGKPGQPIAGTVTITAPDNTFDVDATTPGVQGDADTDRDPVEGQSYTLSIDRGFFTSGDELPSAIGSPGGNLTNLGQTLTGLTDADGEVAFRIGIERNKGFNNDNLVDATVNAEAGDLSGDETATWDSSDPLNGGNVRLVLSPRQEQENPVNPAVAGDRTYYDVVTTDQFGNPVAGEPVELTFGGNLDDWDYSDDFIDSDLDRSGDFWIVSFEAAEITVTGTWNAPTTTYVNTGGTTTSGHTDLTGSAIAKFYEINFKASKFTLKSNPRDTVKVGKSVTQTVRVVDQLGNPVRGYDVKFFRSGPDGVRSEPRARGITNAKGQASYTFVGTELGLARITAIVTDGLDSRTLTNKVAFGSKVRARLSGFGNAGPVDRLTVEVDREAEGARVQVFRFARGKLRSVGSQQLGNSGKVRFNVRDRNGQRRTKYIAVVRSTQTTVRAWSNKVKVR